MGMAPRLGRHHGLPLLPELQGCRLLARPQRGRSWSGCWRVLCGPNISSSQDQGGQASITWVMPCHWQCITRSRLLRQRSVNQSPEEAQGSRALPDEREGGAPVCSMLSRMRGVGAVRGAGPTMCSQRPSLTKPKRPLGGHNDPRCARGAANGMSGSTSRARPKRERARHDARRRKKVQQRGTALPPHVPTPPRRRRHATWHARRGRECAGARVAQPTSSVSRMRERGVSSW